MRRFALVALMLLAVFSLLEMDHAFVLFWEMNSKLPHKDIISAAVVFFLYPFTWIVVSAIQNWRKNA